MAEGLSRAQQSNEAVRYDGRFDRKNTPLARLPDAENSDYSQPVPGEYAGPKNVINLESMRYKKKMKEGKVGEFGEIIERDDIRDKIAGGGKVEKKEPIDVGAIVEQNKQTEAEIRNAVKDMGIEKIADLDFLIDALSDLKRGIENHPNLSKLARMNFRLDPEYNYTVDDLLILLESAKKNIENGSIGRDEIEMLPFQFPNSYGIQEAVKKIVENLLSEEKKQ